MLLTDAIRKTNDLGVESTPRLNLLDAGYDGFYPELAKTIGGKNFEKWMNNAAYVSNNIIPIVVRTPKMFDVLADATLGARLRNLYIAVMTHIPLTITGFEATVTLETAEHRAGAAGELHEEFTKASRSRTRITKTYVEKLGKPLNRFFDFIIRYGIKDPDTQSPLLTTLTLTDNSLEKGELLTPDYYTGSILYLEPDMINKNVVEAYYCVNVAPKSAGEVVSKRDLGAGGETKEYSIEFTSITRSGEAIRRSTQLVLDRMSIFDKSPDKNEIVAIHDDELARSLSNEFSFNEEPVSAFEINDNTAFNS